MSRLSWALAGAACAVFLAAVGVFAYYWIAYAHMIDDRLAGHIDQTTARIYSAPTEIADGEVLPEPRLIDALQRAGYSELRIQGAPGWYSAEGPTVEIHPQRNSYFAGKNALRVRFSGNTIGSIRLLDNASMVDTAQIEPELLTNLFDRSREKRRRVRFAEIPPVLLDAVLSAEDKRFFEHPGFDLIRIAGAAWADLRHDAKAQGASTLTMQLARSFFFTTARTWRRKIAETMVALQLERRFTKQQIFELYANEIYLGNRGSFAIHGFGEGAIAYFNKDIRDLSLNQAAFLAGIIRAPNRYSSADRKPNRAAEARDRVLRQMVENHYITPDQMRQAQRAPLHLTSGGLDNTDAPYFVDMVKDRILDHYSQAELLSEGFRVYTTLDPELERAATEAVSIGVDNVDHLLAHRYAVWRKQGHPIQAQVALVALDPHTGRILALVGGRNYGQSQLNHVLASRQPGSVFKPFVYAAAFDNAVEGLSPIVTPVTTVVDEPTTFDFDGQEYTPNNYGEEFHGTVTLRDALTDSLNVATVKLAEMIGYSRVVDFARQIGITDKLQPTPALALGAYEMTPLEVAGAYTAFANGGVRAEPMFIDRVTNARGTLLEQNAPRTRQVLDPRVVYQLTSVLEDVINRGTAASVRARGFLAPAAGKTGTSHDGWFAGYTSNLLCIVWVGFDDNRDLNLTGSAAAAPIWTEFMKRAAEIPAYRDMQEFVPPEGVTVVDIDPQSLQLATPSCPVTRKEVFIAGTEPTQFCELHGGPMMTQTPPGSWLSRLFGGGHGKSGDGPAPPSSPMANAVRPLPSSGASSGRPSPPQVAAKTAPSGSRRAAPAEGEKKGGLLHRIFGIFGGAKNPDKQK
jgi:penicillin-binding protein 1B